MSHRSFPLHHHHLLLPFPSPPSVSSLHQQVVLVSTHPPLSHCIDRLSSSANLLSTSPLHMAPKRTSVDGLRRTKASEVKTPSRTRIRDSTTQKRASKRRVVSANSISARFTDINTNVPTLVEATSDQDLEIVVEAGDDWVDVEPEPTSKEKKKKKRYARVSINTVL